MRYALTMVFLILCIILQLGLREVGYYFSLSNIALMYLCLLLSTYDTESTLWFALGVGIVLDVLSGTPDGVMALSIPAGVKFAQYIGNTFFRERLHAFLIPSYSISATFGCLTFGLLVLGVMSLVGWTHSQDFQYYFSWLLPITIGFNVLSLVAAFWLYKLELMIQNRFLQNHESI